jgi:hypothetical protein
VAEVTIDLQTLQNILAKSSNRELEKVTLHPSLIAGYNLNIDDLAQTPSVMSSFVLVPSLAYRFGYFDYRYLLLGYLLERNGSYESGQFEIISNAAEDDPKTEVFSQPTLWTRKITNILTGASLGVDLGVAYDSSLSEDGYKRFGITFKITSATPAVFPTLRMFYISALACKS